MNDERNPNILLAFGLGVAIGAVAGLLLAPATGAETRRRVGEMGHRFGDKAREGADQASRYVKDQAKKFERAFQEGRQAYQEKSSES